LRDLEQGAADLKTIANANGIVGQPFNGEVLAELSVNEVGPLQLLRPVAIGFELVNEDGSLLTPMAAEICLTISVQIQPSHPAAAMDRTFPDCGAHRSPLPRDIVRKPDVH
jgi:hypothetical protein